MFENDENALLHHHRPKIEFKDCLSYLECFLRNMCI